MGLKITQVPGNPKFRRVQDRTGDRTKPADMNWSVLGDIEREVTLSVCAEKKFKY